MEYEVTPFSTLKVSFFGGEPFLYFEAIQEIRKRCEWFPVCLGPCNRQLMAHQGEEICTFDAINMNRKEFLMYIFKYSLLQDELMNVNE